MKRWGRHVRKEHPESCIDARSSDNDSLNINRKTSQLVVPLSLINA